MAKPLKDKKRSKNVQKSQTSKTKTQEKPPNKTKKTQEPKKQTEKEKGKTKDCKQKAVKKTIEKKPKVEKREKKEEKKPREEKREKKAEKPPKEQKTEKKEEKPPKEEKTEKKEEKPPKEEKIEKKEKPPREEKPQKKGEKLPSEEKPQKEEPKKLETPEKLDQKAGGMAEKQEEPSKRASPTTGHGGHGTGGGGMEPPSKIPKTWHFTSSESDGGFSTPLTLENLEGWKSEAKEAGMTLEEYMEELSRGCLESRCDEHMKALMAEDMDNKGEMEPKPIPQPKDASESPSSEEGSSESESSDGGEDEDAGEGEGEEEEDTEDDHSVDSDVGDGNISEDVEELMGGSEDEKPAGTSKSKKAVESVEATKIEKTDTQMQIVVAAGGKAQEDYSNANSKTHKTEWGKFCRQATDRKKFPVQLAPHFVSNKLDVFRSWLEVHQNWDDVLVQFERKAERKVSAKKRRSGTKERDIHKRYPKHKAEALVKRLREKGLWYYDPDFPGDEEDCLYSSFIRVILS